MDNPCWAGSSTSLGSRAPLSANETTATLQRWLPEASRGVQGNCFNSEFRKRLKPTGNPADCLPELAAVEFYWPNAVAFASFPSVHVHPRVELLLRLW